MSSGDTQLIAKLTACVETLTNAVDSLRKEIKEIGEKHTQTHVQVQQLTIRSDDVASDLAAITQIVLLGSQQPPLTARVATLESTSTSSLDDIADLKTKYDVAVTSRLLTKGQIIAGVLGMVFTALLSALALLK